MAIRDWRLVETKWGLLIYKQVCGGQPEKLM